MQNSYFFAKYENIVYKPYTLFAIPANFNEFCTAKRKLRGGAAVARQVHSLKVAGSIPAPATNPFLRLGGSEAAKIQANIWQTSRHFFKIQKQ